MDQEELGKLEARCIQEQPAACAAACPVHVDARSMAGAVARGDMATAAKIFRKSVPFPGIVSRVCDHPCERPVGEAKRGGRFPSGRSKKPAWIGRRTSRNRAQLRPEKIRGLQWSELVLAVLPPPLTWQGKGMESGCSKRRPGRADLFSVSRGISCPNMSLRPTLRSWKESASPSGPTLR